MRKATLAATILLSLAIPAAAQQPAGTGGLGLGTPDEAAPKEVPRAPIARKSDSKPPVLWNVGAFVLIVAFVLGANMIPSKRGHQD